MQLQELKHLVQTRLQQANVQLELDDYDRKLLEKCGPAVFVSNHIQPGLDEWLLLSVLLEHAEKVRLLHPYLTPPPAGLAPIAIRTENMGLDPGIFQINLAKAVLRNVRKGHSLALVIDFSDPPFGLPGKNLLRRQVLRQLRKARQPVVPVHFVMERQNASPLWKTLSNLSMQPNDTVRIAVRVGLPISPEEIRMFDKNRHWSGFLQAKIFSLGTPFDLRPTHFTHAAGEAEQPIAAPVEPELIYQEIAALKPERKIAERGSFDVYVAPFLEIPHTMLEIGRLRELTFRSVGEGAGKDRDLDEYDIYYLHLIIWDRENGKIVGGYRLGQGDVIFKRFGINGFYVSSLFKIQPGFYDVMQQAVELGRSYVVPEYQRHRLPLFLLWKGILHFLLANPRYRYLYGPVSISKYYSEISKGVIVDFIQQFYFDHQLAQFVKPRKPFRLKSRAVDTQLIAENLRGEFDALENFVEDIEPEHFKIPVLFRQYLRQNARFVAFNVDPAFSDCLDGLMVLDISHLPASTIEALQQEK